MSTNCTINCTVNASREIEIESSHLQIEVVSTSELKFALDTDNGETVVFTVPDFTYEGDTYTVAVTSTEGGGSPVSWTRITNGCESNTYRDERDLELDIVATEPGATQIVGGGVIRIRTKGKPDL